MHADVYISHIINFVGDSLNIQIAFKKTTCIYSKILIPIHAKIF